MKREINPGDFAPHSPAEKALLQAGYAITRGGPFGSSCVVKTKHDQKKTFITILEEQPALSIGEIETLMNPKMPRMVLQQLLFWLVQKGVMVSATYQRMPNPTILRTVYWLRSHPPVSL
ncbi:MAG: hypothetical protein HQL99_13210 [Magnetococcales bacterium]|nr:hypothetical protein [Magnetococcales bacterium]